MWWTWLLCPYRIGSDVSKILLFNVLGTILQLGRLPCQGKPVSPGVSYLTHSQVVCQAEIHEGWQVVCAHAGLEFEQGHDDEQCCKLSSFVYVLCWTLSNFIRLVINRFMDGISKTTGDCRVVLNKVAVNLCKEVQSLLVDAFNLCPLGQKDGNVYVINK
ncbi:hypothetical protein EDC96DRAFT_578187 [Choanephora cucurbitarum]|nr:hypothetical protein EDC96DRAFT_578187 [Choanephora cucurbitarum]